MAHRRDILERVGYWRKDLLRFGDREFYNRVRDSDVATSLLPDVTLLRFFAQHWNALYGLTDPPQRRVVSTEPPLFLALRAFLAHVAGGPPPRSSAAEGAAVVERLAEVRALAGL